MQKKNYVQEILDIIHSGLPQAELAEKLSDYHENDLADALADLTAEERRKLYAILGVEQVAEIFSYLDDAEPYLKELPPEEAAQVVSHMDSDDAVDDVQNFLYIVFLLHGLPPCPPLKMGTKNTPRLAKGSCGVSRTHAIQDAADTLAMSTSQEKRGFG